MKHLLRALAFAHDRGFVHGDLKPQNILLTGHDVVPLKLIDCGFGYAIDRSLSPSDLQVSFGRSQRSVSLGVSTSNYAAPERFTLAFVEKPDVARFCDVYALGKVFYQLLTGEVPASVFPLGWSCLMMLLASALSVFCVAEYDGGDYGEMRYAFLSLSTALSLLGLWGLRRRRKRWRERWEGR